MVQVIPEKEYDDLKEIITQSHIHARSFKSFAAKWSADVWRIFSRVLDYLSRSNSMVEAG